MSSRIAPDAGGPSRRPWSLAARLACWYAGSAFTLVAAATAFLYWGLAANLGREDDEELADKVRILRSLLRERPDGLAAIRQEAEWGWAAREHTKVYVRILDAAGRVVLETPGMAQAVTPELFPTPLAAEADPSAGVVNVHTADRRLLLVQAARAEGAGAESAGFVLQIAVDCTAEEELLERYRQSLWLVLGLALVACAVGGYWIARRGLRPLERIAATAQRIRPTTLNERLQTTGLPAELQALADTFNQMLDRLEESFGRLERFSADLAHELRTPVNNLRGEAEVALGRPRSAEEYREVLGSCLEECVRLSRLIDSLLFLARAENPRTQIDREPLDVGRELAAVEALYEAAAAEAGVTLTVTVDGKPVAESNRALFHRAVGNLVANALAHTPADGEVCLSASRHGDRVCIEVADTGRGIAPEHLPRLFERFFRADPARSSATGGVGLGLAIVKGIAELHGGSVSIASQVGRGTCVTLLLPAADHRSISSRSGPPDAG